MVRVNLKGLHKVTSKGRTYFYAWRGGPRIDAEPGTPAFIAAFTEAHKTQPRRSSDTLQGLLDAYEDGADFTSLAAKSQKDYRRYLRMIGAEFGTMPIEAIEDRRTRGEFKDWRDSMSATPRAADFAWSVLARVMSYAKDRGRIGVNPCERGGRLYKADRADAIWTEATLAKLFAVASQEVAWVVGVALWTGQRQGDLLRLPWSSFDGSAVRLRQSKGGIRVTVPAGDHLKKLMAVIPRRSTVILTSSDRTPWTSDGFRASFRKACQKAGVEGLTFHDLRGTAVTRLALAGCSESEIAAITGHTLTDVRSILDRHYLSRDVALAEAAIHKLEEHMARRSVKPGVKLSGGSGENDA